jgi:hypothetical protein
MCSHVERADVNSEMQRLARTGENKLCLVSMATLDDVMCSAYKRSANYAMIFMLFREDAVDDISLHGFNCFHTELLLQTHTAISTGGSISKSL